MSRLEIIGGSRLNGTVRVHGAKNAILPILAGTVLNGGKSVFIDCPMLKDVSSSISILKHLGCRVKRQVDGSLLVDSSFLSTGEVPDNLMHEMRSSIIFLGAMLARYKKALIAYPGGCELGPRPIDLHLKALRQMGVDIKEKHGYIECNADNIHGDTIHLDFPSVGATENIMLAGVLAKGETIITNAAKEPEIIALSDYLNLMGAKVYGVGTSVIKIEGVKKLTDVTYKVMPDRIVAATYMAAVLSTGGSAELLNVIPNDLQAVISVCKECGARIYEKKDSLIIVSPKILKPVEIIRTLPHPGFPTDAQSPFMTALTQANGTSIMVENIFENRFKHVPELIKMGANIKTDGKVAVINGATPLSGASVTAMDLRGAAALVVAGLSAEGTTTITGINHLDRGYESIEESYVGLGAKIKRLK